MMVDEDEELLDDDSEECRKKLGRTLEKTLGCRACFCPDPKLEVRII
jgi:hypothetical protein